MRDSIDKHGASWVVDLARRLTFFSRPEFSSIPQSTGGLKILLQQSPTVPTAFQASRNFPFRFYGSFFPMLLLSDANLVGIRAILSRLSRRAIGASATCSRAISSLLRHAYSFDPLHFLSPSELIPSSMGLLACFGQALSVLILIQSTSTSSQESNVTNPYH